MFGKWTDWQRFPDPDNGESLHAPFGPGVYELRRKSTGDLVLVGHSKNTAWRMSSLLPCPIGCGGRNNHEKQAYVAEHLADIEYRTAALATKQKALNAETALRANNKYLFPT